MTTIWHNPRCSKSRQALALLEERGDAVTVRKYLEDAPSLVELRDAQALLDVQAIKMMRTGEAEFKALGLSTDDADETLLAAMATHPKLIERPVVFVGDSAVIARPPEKALTIG